MKVVRDTPTSSINGAELRATRPVIVAVHAATGCLTTAHQAAIRQGAVLGQDWSQEADFAVLELAANQQARPFLAADLVESNYPSRA